MTAATVDAHLPEYTAPRSEHNFHCATHRNSSFTFFFFCFQLSTANVDNNTVDLSHNYVNMSPNTSRYVASIIFLQFFLTWPNDNRGNFLHKYVYVFLEDKYIILEHCMLRILKPPCHIWYFLRSHLVFDTGYKCLTVTNNIGNQLDATITVY